MRYRIMLYVAILFLMVETPVLSQSIFPISKGEVFVNAGVGFHGPAYHSGWRPSLNLSAEYAVIPNLTVGLTGSYFNSEITTDNQFTSFSTGVRALYYLKAFKKKKQDKKVFYAGLGLSYYELNYSDFYGSHGKLYVPLYLGVKRMLTQDIGVNVELGFNDTGFIKVGITKRFK
jgi:hypothetical protein